MYFPGRVQFELTLLVVAQLKHPSCRRNMLKDVLRYNLCRRNLLKDAAPSRRMYSKKCVSGCVNLGLNCDVTFEIFTGTIL
jgi:hypothetical protein